MRSTNSASRVAAPAVVPLHKREVDPQALGFESRQRLVTQLFYYLEAVAEAVSLDGVDSCSVPLPTLEGVYCLMLAERADAALSTQDRQRARPERKPDLEGLLRPLTRTELLE